MKYDNLANVFGYTDILPMWVADMDFQVAPEILDAARECCEKGVFGYTFRSDKAKQAFANWVARRHGWQVDTRWLLSSPGIVTALALGVRVYTQEHDKVMIFTPVYPPFYAAQVQGSSSGFYKSWCAIFISWCARQAGIPTSIISNATYACAGSDYGDFKNLDFYSRGSYTPKVGDLIFFDWLDGDQYVWDHVEIVIGVDSSNVTTLGGNTGTNDVKTRNWNLSHQYIKGYGVPKYTSGSNPTPTPTPTPTPSGSVQDLTNPKNPNKYSTPPSGTYLNVGDSGTYVRWLQACLNQCGYSCDVDGQFGYERRRSA